MLRIIENGRVENDSGFDRAVDKLVGITYRDWPWWPAVTLPRMPTMASGCDDEQRDELGSVVFPAAVENLDARVS
jgi:hypothetical protein